MEKNPMVAKIFSKKILFGIIIILTVINTILVWREYSLQEQIKQQSSKSLDLTLKKKLQQKVTEALTLYPKNGWNETLKVLTGVRWDCKRDGCDFEVFFNELLDSLAATLSSNQEFTLASATLGIIYPGNWKLADIDEDHENEIIILQRDALNVEYIRLKIIDFQSKPRITSFTLPEGYLSSPNSSGLGSGALEIRDIGGDNSPEILTFVSGGKGGAHLYAFRYKAGKLDLILRKDDLLYPEYIFTGKDKNGFSEIVVRGHNEDKEEVTQHLNIF